MPGLVPADELLSFAPPKKESKEKAARHGKRVGFISRPAHCFHGGAEGHVHLTVLQKVENYSTLNAKQSYARGKRAGICTALLHGFLAFFRSYFIRLGILDGAHGVAFAISNAETSYYRYLKLWLLEQEARNETAAKKN